MPAVDPLAVVAVVDAKWGYELGDMIGPSAGSSAVWARHWAAYALVLDHGMAYADVDRLFGRHRGRAKRVVRSLEQRKQRTWRWVEPASRDGGPAPPARPSCRAVVNFTR